jgi:hypothetical protein
MESAECGMAEIKKGANWLNWLQGYHVANDFEKTTKEIDP